MYKRQAQDTPLISAKEGIGIEDVLETIVKKVPAPQGDKEMPLRALIFDSYYDSYRGVIASIRVKEGSIRKGMKIKMMATDKIFEVDEVGLYMSGLVPVEELIAGEVGYVTASIKNVTDTRVGDTITEANRPAAEPLPGYKKINPMVYSGIYPADGSKYEDCLLYTSRCV